MIGKCIYKKDIFYLCCLNLFSIWQTQKSKYQNMLKINFLHYHRSTSGNTNQNIDHGSRWCHHSRLHHSEQHIPLYSPQTLEFHLPQKVSLMKWKLLYWSIIELIWYYWKSKLNKKTENNCCNWKLHNDLTKWFIFSAQQTLSFLLY